MMGAEQAGAAHGQNELNRRNSPSRLPPTAEKAEYVRDMFAGIAYRYDLMNSVLSFNRHKAWRRYAVELANPRPGETALDVCTGTGYFALHLSRAGGASGTIIGSAFCGEMARTGKRKTDR